ncbi:MAG: redoxin domain-containing protein [Acidobacteria bacterium]|nr:redoxin domain-containing protein [Acidobacteriota bacterium]
MKATKMLPALLLMAAFGSGTLNAQGNSSQQPAPKPPEPLKLKVGDTAPDFTLLSFDGQSIKPISLHDFKGKKNVALAFYVFAFTGG